MNIQPLFSGMILALSFTLLSPFVAAGEPYAKITYPHDGDKLGATSRKQIDYEVDPGPRGDHIHLYVDNKEAAILRKLAGSHTLESMAPGPHTLCIKVVNKAHVPIGVEQCVKVNVE
jgi:hypothetical protein